MKKLVLNGQQTIKHHPVVKKPVLTFSVMVNTQGGHSKKQHQGNTKNVK